MLHVALIPLSLISSPQKYLFSGAYYDIVNHFPPSSLLYPPLTQLPNIFSAPYTQSVLLSKSEEPSLRTTTTNFYIFFRTGDGKTKYNELTGSKNYPNLICS